jgi:hypothetical protein
LVIENICNKLEKLFSDCIVSYTNKNDFPCKTDTIFEDLIGFDLDKIKNSKIFQNIYTKNEGNKNTNYLKSADMLLITQEGLIFIEFKNPDIKVLKSLFYDLQNSKNIILKEKLNKLFKEKKILTNYKSKIIDSQKIIEIIFNISLKRYTFIFLISLRPDAITNFRKIFLQRFKSSITKYSYKENKTFFSKTNFAKDIIYLIEIFSQELKKLLLSETRPSNTDIDLEVYNCDKFKNFYLLIKEEIVCPKEIT